jgi:hypothetical protein
MADKELTDEMYERLGEYTKGGKEGAKKMLSGEGEVIRKDELESGDIKYYFSDGTYALYSIKRARIAAKMKKQRQRRTP